MTWLYAPNTIADIFTWIWSRKVLLLGSVGGGFLRMVVNLEGYSQSEARLVADSIVSVFKKFQF